MIIKNKKELAVSEQRRKLLEIAEAGVERVLPENLLPSFLKYDPENKILQAGGKVYDISKKRVFVVGGGKAAGKMAQVLEEIMGESNIVSGVVISKKAGYKTKKIKIIKGGHPIPTSEGVDGVREMLNLKHRWKIGKNDLVICLISGGGSSLMTLPQDGLTLKDLRETTSLLLKSGAEIQEINCVRKHLSKIKGGRLGKFFAPATLVSLIISDVIDDKLEVIASGPTYPDSSTFRESLEVLKKYNIESSVPKDVVEFLKKGTRGEIEETPKDLKNCDNFIIGDNKLALNEMAKRGKEMGLKPFIVTASQKGTPEKVANLRAEEIIRGKYKNFNLILIGGETTPQIPKEHGKGGRCQHFSLASLIAFKNYKKRWALISLATDGTDFLEGIAGAIVDNESLKRAREKGLKPESFLQRYDSYNFLKKVGNSIIMTDYTETNVSDVMVYLFE